MNQTIMNTLSDIFSQEFLDKSMEEKTKESKALGMRFSLRQGIYRSTFNQAEINFLICDESRTI